MLKYIIFYFILNVNIIDEPAAYVVSVELSFPCLPTPSLEVQTKHKTLALDCTYSQFRRNRTFNFILSNIYVDKRSRIR